MSHGSGPDGRIAMTKGEAVDDEQKRQPYSVVVRLFTTPATETQARCWALEAVERAMMDSGGDIEGYQFEGMRLAKPGELESLDLEDV